MTPTVVRYRERASGVVREETIFSEGALRWFYEDPLGSRVFAALLNRAWFSRLYGFLQDVPASRKAIPAFVATHGIDLDEVLGSLDSFRSFNDFFCRRLVPGARPFPAAPGELGSPAEGKILVYPELGPGARLPVKGALLDVETLTGSEAIAHHYRHGLALVIRLAPYDYHRFHFPDDGVPGAARVVPGRYHSVSPIATARLPDVLLRNRRMVTHLESVHFGALVLVEVGALTVGTIQQTYAPGERVARGDEKGTFRFGGSTLVMLLEAGRVGFDDDLLEASTTGLEVQVKAGERVGRHL